MAFIGYGTYNGQDVPVFEFLEDVPDAWINNGVKFGLKNDNLPIAPAPNQGFTVQAHSPAFWVFFAALPLIVQILVAIIFIVAIIALITVAFWLFGPRSVSKIPGTNSYQDPCGCIYNPGTDSKGNAILVPANPGCMCEQPLAGIKDILVAGGVLILIGAAAYIGVDLYRTFRPGRRAHT